MKINMKQGEEMTNMLEYEACVCGHQKWSMAIGTGEKLVTQQEMQCEEWKDYWIVTNVKAIGFPKESVVLIVRGMN